MVFESLWLFLVFFKNVIIAVLPFAPEATSCGILATPGLVPGDLNIFNFHTRVTNDTGCNFYFKPHVIIFTGNNNYYQPNLKKSADRRTHLTRVDARIDFGAAESTSSPEASAGV